jgi:hypothetical protein
LALKVRPIKSDTVFRLASAVVTSSMGLRGSSII